MNTPLWTPRQDQIEKTNLFDFASVHGFMKDGVVDYPALHAWSIDDMDAFLVQPLGHVSGCGR